MISSVLMIIMAVNTINLIIVVCSFSFYSVILNIV